MELERGVSLGQRGPLINFVTLCGQYHVITKEDIINTNDDQYQSCAFPAVFSNYLYYIHFLKSYHIIHHGIQMRELGTFCHVYVCTRIDGSMLLIYYYYYILPSFLRSGFL